ncbi:hypothetical protein E1162_10510 [Rhodobacteraceae bacterium RKSG542]|uniref:hypothetical protein n=1 Tax=Pseudovibrio flavus TaxID=2529854 RepID=UPI0012BD783B|nr:hypothetical protein [Pseudovibrio flavus]MTI17671.1 hypothetical protein [Pseudovibrio flavus]
MSLRFLVRFFSLFAVFALLAHPAASSDHLRETDYPDLRGVWHAAQARAIYWHRDTVDEATQRFALEIQEQEGPALEGELHWKTVLYKGPDHDGVREVHEGREPVIGMISWAGDAFTLVEHPDSGTIQGRILEPNTIEIMQFEAGNKAMVARYLLVRSPARLAGTTLPQTNQ